MYKLITFDMFSALLDIEGSALPRVEAVLRQPPEQCLRFFRLWRTRQWDYVLLSSLMARGFLTYHDITWKTLEYAAKKTGLTLSQAEKLELMDIWTNFRAWPEARETVNALKSKGYLVGMLSNGDESMLRQLETSSGISFDYIFAADQAQHYKPHRDIYMLPTRRLDIPREEFLHVAGSLFDMMGAKAAGCNCAWSNRLSEYTIDPQYQPDYETDNLRQLLDIL